MLRIIELKGKPSKNENEATSVWS